MHGPRVHYSRGLQPRKRDDPAQVIEASIPANKRRRQCRVPWGRLQMESKGQLHAASAGLVLDIANGWAALTEYSDCPIHFLGVFAALAAHGGEMPMQDLARATSRSGSSITRAVVKLGAGSFHAPGYGWVEAYEDPQWRRRKLVRLTDHGQHVAAQLLDVVVTRGVDRCCLERAHATMESLSDPAGTIRESLVETTTS